MNRTSSARPHRRPIARLALAILAGALATATSLVPAGHVGAAPIASPEAAVAPAGQGWARFGHFAPSTSTVDVWVDGAPFAEGVSFKNVSGYAPLPSGLHRFEVRPAGDPAAAPLIDVEATVPDGGAITVGAVTTRQGVATQVYDDQLTAPPSGASLVRFIHATPDVAAVDVEVVGGPVLATNVPYPQATEYQPITPGRYDVDVRTTGTADVLLRVSGWSIDAGSQSTIVIIRGLDGQIDVAPIADAAAVGLVPQGGVQTDLGGGLQDPAPADSQGTTSTAWTLVPMLAAGVFLLGWRRRLSRSVA